jgi:hypothetical protein
MNDKETLPKLTARQTTTGDIKIAYSRMIDGLQRLYAMIIALALTTSVGVLTVSLGLNQPSGVPFSHTGSVPTVLMFVAFLSTLVVFYQGMNRHLDETFVCGDLANSHLPLLLDLLVFLAESLILVLIANTINRPVTFFYAWTSLLAVDIAWGLALFWVQRRKATLWWVVNNFGFVFGAWLCWRVLAPENVLLLAVIEVLRSINDWRMNWEFYFPSRSHLMRPEAIP